MKRLNLRKLRLALLFYAAFDLFFGGVCGGFLSLSSMAAAQFTTVSGTVTDPNSIPYAGGTITATLVISGTPIFTATNSPYTPPTGPVGLNSAGSFVMQLADVTALTPGGGTYSFTVCSNAGTVQPAGGKGPICFTVTGQTISGASQDLTTTLTTAAPALTFSGGGGGGNVSGSGTSGFLVEWNALHGVTNSQWQDSGGTLLSTNTSRLNITLTVAGTPLLVNSSPTSAPCGGSGSSTGGFNTNLTGHGCQAIQAAFVPNSSQNAVGQTSALYGAWSPVSNGIAAAITGAGVFGAGIYGGNGSPLWVAGVAGNATNGGASGTIGNLAGVVGLGALGPQGLAGGQTATELSGVYGQIQNNTTGTTQPLGAAFYVDTPSFTAPVAHVYGLYVADQAAGGANNPDPHAIHTAGTAPSDFGGALTVAGTLTLSGIAGAGPLCLQISSGVVSAAAAACGSGAVPSGGVGQTIAYNNVNAPVATSAFIDNSQSGGTGVQENGPVTINGAAGQFFSSAIPTSAFSCGANAAGFGFDTAANDATNTFHWCNSGGNFTAMGNPMTTLGDEIYGGASGVATRVAGPTTPNNIPFVWTSTPSGGVATAPGWQAPGQTGRAITGVTASDTIVSADCSPRRVEYVGSVSVAVTLPTATTLGVSLCGFKLVNATSGSSTTVTVTPTTWTVNGNASIVLAQGQSAWFSVDPNSATNWQADAVDPGIVVTAPVTATRAAYSLTVACATCVTSASALTSNALVLGGGSQASKTSTGFTTDGVSILTVGVTGATGQVCIAGTTAGVTACMTTDATGLTVNFPTGTTTNPGLAFASNNSNTGFIGNGAGGVNFVSSGTATALFGANGVATGNGNTYAFNRTGTRELGLGDESGATGAALMSVDSTTIGNEGGFLRFANTCRITADVSLTVNVANSFCSFSLPGVAKGWGFICDVLWAITAGSGTNTFALGVNASQTPTGTTNGAAQIYTTTTGTQTNGSAAISASGATSILTGATYTPAATVQQAVINGTVLASATAGTFAITATANGTTATAAIKAGTQCVLN